MASMCRPPSSFAAQAIDNLSISRKMHMLSSTQENPGVPNDKAQTQSDSASTRRTTQHTMRTNGGNLTRSFHQLMAQSTFDHSEGSAINIKTRKAGKTPITSYQDENKVNPMIKSANKYSANKNSANKHSVKKEFVAAPKSKERVPLGERALSNGGQGNNGLQSTKNSNGLASCKRSSQVTTQKSTARLGGAK